MEWRLYCASWSQRKQKKILEYKRGAGVSRLAAPPYFIISSFSVSGLNTETFAVPLFSKNISSPSIPCETITWHDADTSGHHPRVLVSHRNCGIRIGEYAVCAIVESGEVGTCPGMVRSGFRARRSTRWDMNASETPEKRTQVLRAFGKS